MMNDAVPNNSIIREFVGGSIFGDPVVMLSKNYGKRGLYI